MQARRAERERKWRTMIQDARTKRQLLYRTLRAMGRAPPLSTDSEEERALLPLNAVQRARVRRQMRELVRSGKRDAALKEYGSLTALIRVVLEQGMPTLVRASVQRESSTVLTDASLVDEFLTGARPLRLWQPVICWGVTPSLPYPPPFPGAAGHRVRIAGHVFYVPEIKQLPGRAMVEYQSPVVGCTLDPAMDVDEGDEVELLTPLGRSPLDSGLESKEEDEDLAPSKYRVRVRAHTHHITPSAWNCDGCLSLHWLTRACVCTTAFGARVALDPHRDERASVRRRVQRAHELGRAAQPAGRRRDQDRRQAQVGAGRHGERGQGGGHSRCGAQPRWHWLGFTASSQAALTLSLLRCPAGCDGQVGLADHGAGGAVPRQGGDVH